jgi:hypothetical protein
MIVLPDLMWTPKDPLDKRPYSMEWGDELDEGDSITGEPVWTTYPANRGLVVTALPRQGTDCPIVLENGQDRVPYRLSCFINTTLGQTIKRSAIITVQSR